MKKPTWMIVALALTVVSGCASTTEVIDKGSRSGAMQAVTHRAAVPSGYSDLRITASLKTHNLGDYPVEGDLHGTPDYKLLVNIDGHQMELAGTLRQEQTEPRLGDSEAGDGVKYRFQKSVRLPAGKHKVVITLPHDKIVLEREIALADGSSNHLRLEPVYRWVPGKERTGFYSTTSFSKGIQALRVIFNDQAL